MLLHTLLLALVLADPPAATKETPAKPSGIAPSVPALTSEEEDRQDAIINRFIRADVGQLRGADYQKARREFDALGTEAIAALIRGLNKAAEIDHSCPTLVIRTKLTKLLRASRDVELLEYARENIGAGVKQSYHAGSLNDLRVQCMLRKSYLYRSGLAATGPKPVKNLTTAELARAIESEKGVRQKQVLNELEMRRGPEVLTALLGAASSGDRELRGFAMELVDRHLARQTNAVLREKLADGDAETRKASIRVAVRKPALVGDVIDRLDDAQSEVREEAHAALVKLSKGKDFGPRADAEASDRQKAQQSWRTWWDSQKR